MKTITEYQPLIFGSMRTNTAARQLRRSLLISRAVKSLPAVHLIAGLALMADTGTTPLDWEFWMVFAPLFFAFELAGARLGRALKTTVPQPEAPTAESSEHLSEPVRSIRPARPFFRSLRARPNRLMEARAMGDLVRVS